MARLEISKLPVSMWCFFNWIKRSHIEFTGIYCALMSGSFDSIIVVHFNRTQFSINNKITWKMLLLWFLITCHIRLFPTKICLIKYLSLHKLGQSLTNSLGTKRLYWLILKIGKLFKCKSIYLMSVGTQYMYPFITIMLVFTYATHLC